MERRKANVSNLGSTWLKPPGVSKTLFQMREEERERQEHEEAMRREEMLARELAEAEAAAAAVAAGEIGGTATATVLEEGVAARVEGGMEVADTNTVLPGGAAGGGGDDMEMMEGDDNEMDEMGGRDLDEDIPDADEGGFGYDGASDDDEEEEGEEHEEEHEEEDEPEEDEAITDDHHANEDDEDTVEAPQAPPTTSAGSSMRHSHRRNDNNDNNHQQQSELANVRANEERMREMMARGGLRPTHINLAAAGADEDDEDIDEEDRSHMLEEDDIIGTANNSYEDTEGMMDDNLGMNANLDDDIPDADQDEHAHQSGFYEHTDSEAELLDSESDNEQEQVNTGMGGNGHNIGQMGNGSHRRGSIHQNRVSYGPGLGSGSSQGQQHRRVSLPRQQQQHQQHHGQRLLRASLAGSARRSTIGAPRSSLDISGLLSVDESSPMMRSSPRVRRMH